MKNIKLILTVSLLLTAFIGNAQITKTIADDIVINMLGSDTISVVYSLNESISRGENILTADGKEIINPYDNSYVYFIDNIPAANWTHPCRYCFVNTSDGTYTIENDIFYPYDYESFTRIGEQECEVRWVWPHTNYTIPTKAAPNGKLYAVLIAGDCGTNGAPIKLWYDLSCVYTALVNRYGYMEETANSTTSHLIVCTNYEVETAMENIYSTPWNASDLNQSGGFYDIYDFNHTYSSKQDVQTVFQNLSGASTSLSDIPELTENDQLFVMLCGVANVSSGNTRILLQRGSSPVYLYDYDLANWVRNIKCSQMTFLIDCNYAGGFIDNLMNDNLALCKNRAVHTSTDNSHLSYVEQHITQSEYNRSGNDAPRIDEYIYYWAAASLGYYPILECFSNHITGPWYKYDQTAIGQFHWEYFTSFGEGSGYSHVGYDVNPDANNDGIVSMDEAFTFADNLDSYSPNGYFNPCGGNTSDVEYPQSSYESTFTKALITLAGYKGKISNNAATGVGHNYSIDGKVIVAQNTTLTISNNSLIEGNNKILENHGNFVTATNTNSATFKRVNIINKEGGLALAHCVFDTCGTINTSNTPFSITYSVFNQTGIVAEHGQIRDPYNVVINNNTFNRTLSGTTIKLHKIPQCNVSGNNITSGGNGVEINKLSGVYSNYVFAENNIHDCGGSGFAAYNSNGLLNENVIYDNDVDGLQSINLSSLHVKGDSLASSRYYTQRIIQNNRYQVYASNNSYPQDFHYNWLQGNGTNSDYILFFESNNGTNNRPVVFDVTNNHWYPLSNSNIPQHLLLTGNAVFSYLPTWTPTAPALMPDESGAKLSQGDMLAANGNYEEARDVYIGIVSDFPASHEAVAALKALFSVEVETEGDFSDLKKYYLELSSDDYLGDVADNLANRCDVEMGNYTDAIGWYEDKLADPATSYSERIFAEIDLGDLYNQMADNGNKGIQGKMTEYIPVSKESHAKRTDYLLSLLPGDMEQNLIFDSKETTASTSAGTKLTCSPNPTNAKITLSYKLNDYTEVEISVFSILGNKIKNINLGKQNIGSHSIELDLSDAPDGMYLCSIQIDGGNKETMKIIIKH